PGATIQLLDQIKRHRRAAQKPIERALEKLERRKFPRRVREFIRRVEKKSDRGSERLDSMAHAALGELVVPYLQTSRSGLTDVEALHAFRIQGKQVRYAMEIFAGAFDADFRLELYPLVVSLQDRLGAINDHVTAAAYFSRWGAKCDSSAIRQAL